MLVEIEPLCECVQEPVLSSTRPSDYCRLHKEASMRLKPGGKWYVAVGRIRGTEPVDCNGAHLPMLDAKATGHEGPRGDSVAIDDSKMASAFRRVRLPRQSIAHCTRASPTILCIMTQSPIWINVVFLVRGESSVCGAPGYAKDKSAAGLIWDRGRVAR